MDSIFIHGGIPLEGTIRIQGSKNAALPILAASILIKGKTILKNCPQITDVEAMLTLLSSMGAQVTRQDDSLIIDAANVRENRLPFEQVMSMRSSILLLGPVLSRMQEISLQYPGGCVIGKRPVNLHLWAMEQMQVKVEDKDQGFIAKTKGLFGTEIELPISSVGVTENVMLAAVLAEGKTIIRHAAMEPEIEALGKFLKKAGAKIEGLGTSTLEIAGVKKLQEITYRIPPDRIATGTYCMAAMITHGQITMKQVRDQEQSAFFLMAEAAGAIIRRKQDSILFDGRNAVFPIPYIRTEIYPGFPTDLQSQMLAFLCLCQGDSIIEETIFENRFRVVNELNTMGAKILIKDSKVFVSGVKALYGRTVVSEELRGGAALVLAGLAAEGVTTIKNKHFIDRGYENLCKNLAGLGARIESD